MDNQPDQTRQAAWLDVHALIADARNGDPAATAELLRCFRPLLAHNVRQYTANQGGHSDLYDTEDLWQEGAYAFLTLVRRYDPSRGVPFAGYLRALLRRHFQHLERQLEQPATVSMDAATLAGMATVVDDATDVTLRDLFSHLTPRQAYVLEAVYIRGKSMEEAGNELGVSTRAVGALHQRALATLQKLLDLDANVP